MPKKDTDMQVGDVLHRAFIQHCKNVLPPYI